MRRILASLLVALPLVGCVEIVPRPPPSDRFYYPVGLAHVDVSGAQDGILYVASANGDRCYDNGALRAVDLDALPVGLPPIGAPVGPGGPVQLEDLGADTPELQVEIGSFAGEMAVWTTPEGAERLIVPSRAEGGYLNVVDASGTTLSCVPASDAEGGRDCTATALALENALEEPGVSDYPRVVGPYGVAVADDGDMFVTHTGQPPVTLTDISIPQYVLRMRAGEPTVTADNFLQVPFGGTQSVAIGSRYAFITARSTAGGLPLVFAVPRDTEDTRLRNFSIQAQIDAESARGIALSADQSRLFVTARASSEFGGSADQLLVLSVDGADTNAPNVALIRRLPLPSLPTSIRLLERTGRTPLVLMTMQGSGALAIYDDAVGQLVNEVLGVGLQPGQLSVDLRETTDGSGGQVQQARVFISNFGDGRVAVVDLPDLRRPEDARLVAHLGRRQDDVDSQQSKTCRMVE